MSSATQPADVAAKAMQAVHDGERDTWVGLFAPDALLEDPVAVRAPGGARATYDAALHYTLDESGAIASLRAFWDLPAVMAQFAAPA